MIKFIRCPKCSKSIPDSMPKCPYCGFDPAKVQNQHSSFQSSSKPLVPLDATHKMPEFGSKSEQSNHSWTQFFRYGWMPLQRYFDFSGRSRRMEYWSFCFFDLILMILISAFVGGLGLFVFWMLTIIPSFSLTTRRLHDIGKSGWWQLLYLLPLLGFIILLVWFCFKGDEGHNQYGPNPRENGF